MKLLERVKNQGDFLIVGLSTDWIESAKTKKLHYSYEHRKFILETIDFVNEVIPEKNWEQKISDIKKYNIDTFVIGDDWKGKFVLKGILWGHLPSENRRHLNYPKQKRHG